MRNSLSVFAFALLSLLVCSAASAQTTLTLNTSYNCMGFESHYKFTAPSEIFCTGGVPFTGADGNVDAQIQFNGSGRFLMYSPFSMFMCVDPATATLPPAQEQWHFSSLTVTGFSTPANGNPGTLNFDWQGYDNNGGTDPYGNHICGGYHYGSGAELWTNGGPNWRGWYWAVLQPGSTFTINQ